MSSFCCSNFQFSYSKIDIGTYVTSCSRVTPRLQSANISYLMHLTLLYKIEYVCRLPNRFGMGQALTQLAVKILFDYSSCFDEMRWTINLSEKQNIWIFI